MKMSLFISLCCGVVFYSSAVQAACVQPPSCDELGFTADASKCEGSFLKCPWDLSKAACKEKAPQAPMPILYGDGTFSKDIIPGKTPIGIVFDTENRLAVALTDVKKDGTAGSETMFLSSTFCNISGLQNCPDTEISVGTNLTPITCGVDGRLNTNALLVDICNGTDYGAPATNSYQPAGCTKDFCKKSKWFVPSLRDLQNIYLQKTQIDASLTLLSSNGATAIGTKNYWSSTGFNNGKVWVLGMGTGGRGYSGVGHTPYYVKPVLAF